MNRVFCHLTIEYTNSVRTSRNVRVSVQGEEYDTSTEKERKTYAPRAEGSIGFHCNPCRLDLCSGLSRRPIDAAADAAGAFQAGAFAGNCGSGHFEGDWARARWPGPA